MAAILIKSFGIWLLILLAAVGNGVFRDLVMAPAMGDPLARAISCVTLSLLILFVTLLFIKRFGIFHESQLWSVGWFWLALTLAFEFLFGHYVGKKSWTTLFADYNILEGRLWILVPVTTLFAPVLAGRIRRVG
jgi:hypothetical protein